MLLCRLLLLLDSALTSELCLHLGVGGRRFLQCALELLVCLLLDGLRVLEFLDELHLDALHIQNFILLLSAHNVLNLHLVVLVAVGQAELASLLLFLLHLSEALLLVDDLVLHFVLSLDLELVVADLLLVLSTLHLCLLGLFSLGQVDRFLDFLLLVGALLLDHVVLVGGIALHLNSVLHFSFFLKKATKMVLDVSTAI